MADEYGLAALFLCMQPQTDAAITKRIMKLMKQPSYFAGDELSVDEALGICERVVFMAAMRLHAAIYAIKQSKPVIGLIYDPKVRGVLSDAGHCRFINVEDTDASVLYGFAREILTDIGTPQTADIEEKVKMNVRLAAALMRNKLFTGDGLC
jgi:polysaccharide pyruvyl transferase WcaK-like protein